MKYSIRSLFFVFSVLSAFICSPALFAQQDVPPVMAYVDYPDFSSARISPDGKHIAMVVPQDNKEMIVIMDADNNEIKGSFITDSNNGIYEYWWANEERIVFSTTINQGGSDQVFLSGNLYAFNIDDTKKFLLAGPGTGEYASYSVLDILKDNHNSIMAVRERIRQRSTVRSQPEAMIMDIYTPPSSASSTRIVVNRNTEEISSPFPWGTIATDNSGSIRIAYAANEQGFTEVQIKDENNEWRDITSDVGVNNNTYLGALGIPIGFNEDNSGVYHLALSEYGTVGISMYDIASAQSNFVFADERYDITSSYLIYSANGEELVGINLITDTIETHYFSDHPDVAFHRSLTDSLPGYLIEFQNFTLDQRKGIAMVSGPSMPPGLFILDRDKGEFTPLFTSRPELQSAPSSTQEVINFTARDGVPVQAFLTHAVGDIESAPLIVLPHGGPHGMRDIPLFDTEVKLLASRGYSVLQVNFRGSGGYGLEFMELGYRNWGQSMIDDIVDGVESVVEQGKVDGERMCMMGASYGGYAALMAVARYPDLFQCSIGVVGVYDLSLMRRSDIPFVPGGEDYIETIIGSDENEMNENSPLFLADQISVPVMLAVGGQDRRVHPNNSKRLRRALRRNGNDPEWFHISSAAHGFYRPENREEFYSEVLDFLAEHLGN